MIRGWWGLADVKRGKRISDIGWGLSEYVDIKGTVGMSRG